ncbi:MAG: nuclear transport factor 2 family protein [Pseudolabrys sp.]
MTVSLPKAVEAYFAGTNAHEPDAIAQVFAANGLVHDEAKVHRGRAAIADWARDTVTRYRMTITPLSATAKDGKIVVKAKVEGTFPGSPIELTFNFELDGEAIKSLKVG